MLSLLVMFLSWFFNLIDISNQLNQEILNCLYLIAEKESKIEDLKNIIEGLELEITDLKSEVQEWKGLCKQTNKYIK